MRRLKLIVCVVALTMVATTAGAFACTGMYVGKDASTDGTTIVARSEDQGSGAYNKMFKVQKRVTKAGRYFTDTGTGFKVKLPKTTYKYTYVPDSTDAGDGMYPASCDNEYGVSVIGTVSTEVSKAYEAADPCTEYEKGLREAILPGLVAGQCKTAKQGVEVLAKLVDTYGSAEWNTLFIADQNEAWIFEIYGGTTYCAYRMPSDTVAVFGNQCMIGEVDENNTTEYVFSKNLFSTIDKVGAVKTNGHYNLVQSIVGSREEYSNMRTWEGHRVLAPSTVGAYENDTYYPLCYKPDSKVSPLTIMNLYRDRYEGTDYDMSNTANASRRPIGTTRSSDVHVTQIYSSLPKDTCCLQWLCMGNAEHSVFVPTFSGITSTASAYTVDGSAYKSDSAYWIFKKNCTIAESDRAFLSAGTKAFWATREKEEYAKIQAQLPKVKAAYSSSKTKGRAYVTAIGKSAVKVQLNNSETLHKALVYTSTYNNNDRVNNARKVTFVKPITFLKNAKKAGYTVTVKGSKYIVAKDGVKYTLTKNSTSVYNAKGSYVNDMTYPIYESNGTLWAPADFADALSE